MLMFEEQGKPEYLEKNVESGNQTRATLEGSECSQHCAIPAPLVFVRLLLYCVYRVLWLVGKFYMSSQ